MNNWAQQNVNIILYETSEFNESEVMHWFKNKVKFNINATLSKSSSEMIQ